MKIIFVGMIGMLIILSFSELSGQGWKNTTESFSVPGVTFQWRRFGRLMTDDRAFVEWRFVNTSDSIISFTYRILSDSGDERPGKVSLRPHALRLSGWYFAGDKIQRLELTDLTYQPPAGKPAQ